MRRFLTIINGKSNMIEIILNNNLLYWYWYWKHQEVHRACSNIKKLKKVLQNGWTWHGCSNLSCVDFAQYGVFSIRRGSFDGIRCDCRFSWVFKTSPACVEKFLNIVHENLVCHSEIFFHECLSAWIVLVWCLKWTLVFGIFHNFRNCGWNAGSSTRVVIDLFAM